MNYEIWSAFQDGTIRAVVGKVPGDLRVAVEIRYLRKEFPVLLGQLEQGSAIAYCT